MPAKKSTRVRCRRGHRLDAANVQIEKRYYTPKTPAGAKSPRRTTSVVRVCLACIAARAKARKAGVTLKDLRFKDA